MVSWLNRLFFKKTISNSQLEGQGGNEQLKRVLTVKDLTFLGIAAVVGAGVFSTIGRAAFDGGPGISILFLITAITCGFSALCYAEFASRVTIAGSAYTYAYISFGEIIAWIIGWSLILEYLIGNVVVAISWSSYLNNLLLGLNIKLPNYLITNYWDAKNGFLEVQQQLSQHLSLAEIKDKKLLENYYSFINAPQFSGIRFIMNIPACLIVLFITYLTYIGIKESKQSTNMMVIFKLIIIVFIIILGFFYVKPENWSPFLPNGIEGVLAGVSAVFYAYIGFDAISTTSEECKNPKRDLPLGMIYSLGICTVLYILVSLVLTGITHYTNLNVDDPLAHIFEIIHFDGVSYIISISALIATTSVLLVFQIGQPRIWMSMSRDGLLPKKFSNIHPKYKTPHFSTLICGLAIAIISLFSTSSIMTDLTSIGTLFAFVIVCIGVLFLPPRKKEENSGYRLPYFNGKYIIPIIALVFIYKSWGHINSIFHSKNEILFKDIVYLIFILSLLISALFTFIKNLNIIPIIGTLSCLYLMTEIPAISWVIFLIWLSIGLTIYFGYSKKNSYINKLWLEKKRLVN